MELAEIGARQDTIAELIRPSMEPLCKDLHRLLSKVPNMKHVLGLIRKAPTGTAFASLLAFCTAALGIADAATQLRLPSPLLRLASVDRDLLKALKREIELLVDFDESRVVNRVTIRPRVDLRLDELREFYAGLPDYLSAQAQQASLHYSGLAIDSLSVVYFPQIGFLLTLPITEVCTPEYLSEQAGMELQFATGRFAYLKDQTTRGTF